MRLYWRGEMLHRRKHSRAYGITWDESTASPAGVRVGQGQSSAVSVKMADNLLALQSRIRRCVMNDAGVIQYYLDPTDSTLKENGDPANLDGTDGQVMVELLQGWLKYSYANNQHTWIISKEQFNGAARLDAFYKNGAWVNTRYCGAYEAALYDVSASRYTNGIEYPATASFRFSFTTAADTITAVAGTSAALTHPFTNLEVGDKIAITNTVNNNGTFTVASVADQSITVSENLTDEANVQAKIETEKDFTASSGDKLSSVSGKAPINYVRRSHSREIAFNRGAGWRQLDYDLVSAIQLFYVVEYADFDAHAKIGAGLSDWVGATWVARSNYNPIETTGKSNSDGNATNNVSNGDGVTGSYMTYRGIENFYGHIWAWVDGINIDSHVPYVTNNDGDWADATTVNYTSLGVTLPAADGYQVTLEQIVRGFLPASVGGDGDTYISDYYLQGSTTRVVMLSGASSSGKKVGLFDWAMNYVSADRTRLNGAWLAR